MRIKPIEGLGIKVEAIGSCFDSPYRQKRRYENLKVNDKEVDAVNKRETELNTCASGNLINFLA